MLSEVPVYSGTSFLLLYFPIQAAQNWIRKDKNERVIHIFNKLLRGIAIIPDKNGRKGSFALIEFSQIFHNFGRRGY